MPMHLILLGGDPADVEQYVRIRQGDLRVGWYGEPSGENYAELKPRVVQESTLQVGEMSWIDTEAKSPPQLVNLTDLLFSAPEITAELIVNVHKVLAARGTTSGYEVADPDLVASWLGEHIGERVFYELS